MRRLRVRFRPSAARDLEDIAHYLLKAGVSPATVAGFIGRIRARCLRIGDAPSAGTPRNDLLAGLRIIPFATSVVIAYIVERQSVRITNIFYGGRDYEALIDAKRDDLP